LVQYVDGSVIAELGNPDMRTPIAHALAYPERIDSGVEPLDLFKIASLHFERPDFERFPCLALAYRALRVGDSAPASLNAANEVAVQSFLDGKIGFSDIPRIISAVMDQSPLMPFSSLKEVMAADYSARRMAEQGVEKLASI
jgi:1-deoxy-D-xylulose-5-phosphate reductoisomerase